MNNTEALTLKYNRPVPRYTSYPTAPHFHNGITSDMYKQWLGNIPNDETVSIYVHIPFCKAMCWYCGCNTRITSNSQAMNHYCNDVINEIEMAAKAIGTRLKVSHFQWGGGTPTYIHPDDFKAINDAVKKHFDLADDAEYAVEIDPRTLTKEMANTLAECGVNRVSFGVQDFDEEVQKAVNRIQPYDMTEESIKWLRDAGVAQVNLDLMYGLPLQTVESVKKSVALAASLNPDRLALFGYAHVPWMKKHQQLLEKWHLPTQEERYEQFVTATDELENHGFNAVGIDHFAKDADPMWIAKKDGSLRRNFQGYTTDTADTLIGFGASAVSCLPDGYSQNNPSTKAYEMLIRDGLFPIHKGIETDKQDKLRRDIIMTIMCHHKADLKEISVRHNMAPDDVKDALPKMQEIIDDGLLKIEDNVVALTEPNHAMARVVASCFDTYFEDDGTKHAQAV